MTGRDRQRMEDVMGLQGESVFRYDYRPFVKVSDICSKCLRTIHGNEVRMLKRDRRSVVCSKCMSRIILGKYVAGKLTPEAINRLGIRTCSYHNIKR